MSNEKNAYKNNNYNTFLLYDIFHLENPLLERISLYDLNNLLRFTKFSLLISS